MPSLQTREEEPFLVQSKLEGSTNGIIRVRRRLVATCPRCLSPDRLRRHAKRQLRVFSYNLIGSGYGVR